MESPSFRRIQKGATEATFKVVDKSKRRHSYSAPTSLGGKLYISISPPPGDKHLRNLSFQNPFSLRTEKSFNEGSRHEDDECPNEQMQNETHNFCGLITAATMD
jgi:hypothetical protein